MKKLNTIFSFVLLSFCLLINVSYGALDVNGQASWEVKPSTQGSTTSYSITSNYTLKDIWSISKGYYEGEISESIYKTMCDDLKVNGFAFIGSNTMVTGSRWAVTVYPFNTVDVGYVESESRIYLYGTSTTDYWYSQVFESNEKNIKISTSSTASHACYSNYVKGPPLLYTNDIKSLTILSSKVYWDEETYFYKIPTEPLNPAMPTNAEIAQAVQLFNDNVYDEEKTGKICGFSDFFVLYDKSTKKYSYIGHGMGNSLGQLIVAPNYYYEGYKFDKQWWKFFKDTENNDYNIIRDLTKYFVYVSDGTLDTLTYIGSSNISGLIEKSGPWATDTTIIVYSTIDYPVKNITFDSSTSDPIIETGTIEGDQYTYDENLDIADNNYNPLDNFITVDPVDTVIGNVNFSEINKTFEENKGILNIENASWLFTANNKLIGYFLGFLSLLIVFLIISRILGG